MNQKKAGGNKPDYTRGSHNKRACSNSPYPHDRPVLKGFLTIRPEFLNRVFMFQGNFQHRVILSELDKIYRLFSTLETGAKAKEKLTCPSPSPPLSHLVLAVPVLVKLDARHVLAFLTFRPAAWEQAALDQSIRAVIPAKCSDGPRSSDLPNISVRASPPCSSLS